MATRESRSEAWRGVFLISDGDLDYFDRDHDGFTSESSVDDDDDDDDNGSPASPCIQVCFLLHHIPSISVLPSVLLAKLRLAFGVYHRLLCLRSLHSVSQANLSTEHFISGQDAEHDQHYHAGPGQRIAAPAFVRYVTQLTHLGQRSQGETEERLKTLTRKK